LTPEVKKRFGMAYVYKVDDGTTALFLAVPLCRERLLRALPLTDAAPGATHLVAHFVGGVDYVGFAAHEDVERRVQAPGVVPVDDATAEVFGEGLPALVEFAHAQLAQMSLN
jgi:hypothetical protein